MIVECPGCESRYDVSGRPPGTKARCRCGTIFELPEPSAVAGNLACPRCAGSVTSGQARCGYCDAELLVKACPRCFARMFHGAKHCGACGAQVDVPASVNPDGSAKQLACPCCVSSPVMVARLVGDVLMDECQECHGVWLDHVAVDRLVRERRQVSTQAVLGMGGPKAAAVDTAQAGGRIYRKCPECQTVMNRTNFAKRSGIVIDTCKGHGTWFDADELPKVVEFVMNGGIEASHRAELERERERLRRQEAKLRSGKTSSALTQELPGRHRSSSSAAAFGDLLGAISRFLLD